MTPGGWTKRPRSSELKQEHRLCKPEGPGSIPGGGGSRLHGSRLPGSFGNRVPSVVRGWCAGAAGACNVSGCRV